MNGSQDQCILHYITSHYIYVVYPPPLTPESCGSRLQALRLYNVCRPGLGEKLSIYVCVHSPENIYRIQIECIYMYIYIYIYIYIYTCTLYVRTYITPRRKRRGGRQAGKDAMCVIFSQLVRHIEPTGGGGGDFIFFRNGRQFKANSWSS